MFRASIVFGAVLATIGLAMNATAAADATFERIVVFGDSLSDNGNAGRFSNGPVWVEQLADRFGLTLRPSDTGGDNFAVGGAHLDPRSGLHSLRAQADAFLRMPRARGRTLYVVWGGGNDLLGAVETADGPTRVDAAVASLKSILADLIAQGATDILVANLPDIGMTPAIRARGSTAIAEAGQLTNRFNTGLDRALADIGQRANVRLYRLDVRGMAERARAKPAAFGFADITTPCVDLDSCEGYLFWDDVHPTMRAHTHLAEAAFHAAQSR